MNNLILGYIDVNDVIVKVNFLKGILINLTCRLLGSQFCFVRHFVHVLGLLPL
jgi:hypothetical protein